MLLLYSRLAPELVTETIKKSKLPGATVLKHRADQQQTKSFVYIWCSSRPKLFVCCFSALCFKTVAPSSLLFLTVPVTSLGPSLQSSTPCQQTFPCCTICLVWLALGARKIPYAPPPLFPEVMEPVRHIWFLVTKKGKNKTSKKHPKWPYLKSTFLGKVLKVSITLYFKQKIT